MKISMYLGPSKYWWAWLGLRSNPWIAEAARGFERAIFFDDPRLLPAGERGRGAAHYFCIFWDGIRDTAEIELARAAAGAEANFTALAVGDWSRAARQGASVQGLYPEGAMHFSATPLRFDLRTSAILFAARVKGWLIPLKNIVQASGRRWETAGLLSGRRRIVFCGSYGTTPQAIAELCVRSSVDPGLLDRYEYFSNDAMQSFESYRESLRRNGAFLAGLYDRSAIDDRFLQAAVHLLGREYFILRLRDAGAEMFVHGYGNGNINVYTTPFYRQHLFLDFGSTAGPGNYPRLADLKYFRKRFVAIDLAGHADELARAARDGALEQRFEMEWKRRAAQILDSDSAR